MFFLTMLFYQVLMFGIVPYLDIAREVFNLLEPFVCSFFDARRSLVMTLSTSLCRISAVRESEGSWFQHFEIVQKLGEAETELDWQSSPTSLALEDSLWDVYFDLCVPFLV